jgi:hypothetical protein
MSEMKTTCGFTAVRGVEAVVIIEALNAALIPLSCRRSSAAAVSRRLPAFPSFFQLLFLFEA